MRNCYFDNEKLSAGKRSGGLHSPREGMPVKKQRPRREIKEDTHDYDNVFGWNRKG